MNRVFLFILLATFFIVDHDVHGQGIESDRLEAAIDALVPKSVNDTTPGLVIGVVKNEELIFSKGYGLANLAYGIPNDPKMVYNVGSVSKQFLGYAFAILAEEGRLTLDDPVSKYLEDWPEFDHRVTLRHLLTHTSGYREAYTMSDLAGRIIGVDRLTREECLNVVRRQPKLEFVPGSKYTYNSTAYVILAEIFEKVTGVSAAEWVTTNLLQPLGMQSTRIETFVGEVIPNAAESYTLNSNNQFVNEKSNRAIFGAAEVFVSVEDLAKWVNNYKNATIGGEKVKERFLDPMILNDGTNSEYALGIINTIDGGLKTYMHTGGHEGFITRLNYYPEVDLGVIVISNFGRIGSISASKIAQVVLGDEYEVTNLPNGKYKVSGKKLQQYAGRYVHEDENTFLDLKFEDGQLIARENDEVIPVGPDEFVSGANQLRFAKQADGDFDLIITSGAVRKTYHKEAVWTPTNKELEDLDGDYWSEELETVYHVLNENGKLHVKHRWIGDIPLEPVVTGLFRCNWFYLKVNRDSEGQVASFSINTSHTLDVVFERVE